MIDAGRAVAKLRHRCRDVIRPRRLESELDEELDAYIDLLAAEKTAAGMGPNDARRAALAELGGREKVKVLVRSQRFRLTSALTGAYRDAQAALVPVARTAYVGAVIMLALSVGIATNVALLALQRSLVASPVPAHTIPLTASVARPADSVTSALPMPAQPHSRIRRDSALVARVRPRIDSSVAAQADRAIPGRVSTSPNAVSPPE